MTPGIAATLVVLGILLAVAWVVGCLYLWVEKEVLPTWVAFPLALVPFVGLLWYAVYDSLGGGF